MMGIDWGNSLERFERHVDSTASDMERRIQEVVDSSADEVFNTANRATPVKTGRLKRSWSSVKTGKGSGREVLIDNPVEYGPSVEDGSKDRAPARMLGKGLQSGKLKMNRRLAEAGRQNAGKFNRG